MILNDKISLIKDTLKTFQKRTQIDVSVKDLLDSLDAVKMDLTDIFSSIKEASRIANLVSYEPFLKELDSFDLKLSEYYDSANLQTLCLIPLRWYWIYQKDDSMIDKPVYILFKYFEESKNKWSCLKLYYIQNDNYDFLDLISNVTIEIVPEEGKQWFYTTTNSGMNWKLDTDEKIVKINEKDISIKSCEPTASFRNNLEWDDIYNIVSRKDVKTFVF